MIDYREFSHDRPAVEWDIHLRTFRDQNQFQSHGYGEFERRSSIRTFRSMLTDGPKQLCMCQGLLKEAPIASAAVLMLRGGPLYQSTGAEQTDLKNLKKCLQHLTAAFQTRYRFFYINMIQYSENSAPASIILRESGWTKPLFERAPYLTYLVPIHPDPGKNFAAFDSKWRNQLRQAEALAPEFDFGNSPELRSRYVSLHNIMCRIKSIANFSLTIEGMTDMQNHLGSGLQFMIGTYQGKDVCGCCVGISGSKAYYYYAAANDLGRTKYFSNALIWNLIQELCKQGVAELDLMGIEPRKNWGAYHFKKSIGGRPVEYLGEWEYASHGFLKPLVNYPLYRRVMRMYRS